MKKAKISDFIDLDVPQKPSVNPRVDIASIVAVFIALSVSIFLLSSLAQRAGVYLAGGVH